MRRHQRFPEPSSGRNEWAIRSGPPDVEGRLARMTKAAVSDPISPIVTLERASKVFAGRRGRDAVSLTIEPGEFVAVIGRSGAGKTTLLRCLTGSLPVTDGAIGFGGGELAGLAGRALREHRARVGMIYQQFNLVKRLRVIDNVLIARLPPLDRWA